ncbi:MAG: phosphotransferase family protein [Acidimicrobiia bacterium]
MSIDVFRPGLEERFTLGPVTDVIPVREDEVFDITAFNEWASAQTALPDEEPAVSQFSNGRANLTYLLSYPKGEELVLRRPPLGPVAEGSHDMSREHRVLSRLWKAFPLAPRALALCEDSGVIGSPFFIMERLPGVVVRETVPDIFGGGSDADSNRKLSEVVIDTLAELHAVDPAECGLDDLGHPDGFLQRQVEGWSKRWGAARDEPNDTADEVAAWLRDRIPESPAPALIHNDWRLDNMAVKPDDPGKCAAVYDWDMATCGDPLADLGTLMATWYDPGEAPSSLNPMPTSAPGWMSRADAIERYAQHSGRDLSEVEWYVVFGTWKLGVILQQIYIRWLRGQTKDDRFDALGEGANRLFELSASRRS